MNFLIELATYHTLPLLTGSFALGIITGYYVPLSPALLPQITLTLAMTMAVALWTFSKQEQKLNAKIKCSFLLFSGMGLGLLHISSVISPPASFDHIFQKIKKRQEVVITGTMTTMATNNNFTTATVIESQWIRLSSTTNFIPVKGKVLLRIKGHWPEEILPGDNIIVRADLQRPHSYQSPGAFDYARYLAQKEIWITGFIRSPLFLRKIANNGQTSYTQKIRMFAERCRSKIATNLNSSLPAKKAALYRAILLGDRSGISAETLENFKACGVLHLLAISGLHLTVLWAIFYFLWYWLLSRSTYLLLYSSVHTLAALLTLPLILCYAFLAGLQTPVIRAVIMSSVLVIALLRRQKATGISVLSCAALLLMILQPLQIFTASFQLSFIAVGAIFLLQPWLTQIINTRITETNKASGVRSLCNKIRSYLIAGFVLSLGISILTAPITIFHFNRISFVGPIINLLLEPLLCLWALPLGTLSLPFLYTGNQALAKILLLPGATGIELAQQSLSFAASLPFAFCWVAAPAPFFLWGSILFYLGLLLLSSTREKIAGSTREQDTKKKNAIKYTGCAILTLSLLLFLLRPPARNRVVFLDVGQGSATLFEDKYGHLALIDGGGASFSSNSVGERVIAPYLLHQGKTQIEQVILTHPDADHSNGLNFILTNFSPTTLWLRATDEEHHSHQQLQQTAEHIGCKVKTPHSGEILLNSVESSLGCLYNFGTPQHPQSAKEKNRGIIITGRIGNINFLFPGDIDKQAERQLIATGQLKPTEILLAPHHGSKTSNSTEFLNTITPRCVIVSAGKREGVFPSYRLIKQLKEKNTAMMTTARNGTIEMELTHNGKLEIYSYIRPENNPLRAYRRTQQASLEPLSEIAAMKTN